MRPALDPVHQSFSGCGTYNHCSYPSQAHAPFRNSPFITSHAADQIQDESDHKSHDGGFKVIAAGKDSQEPEYQDRSADDAEHRME